jgi:integrase
VRPASPSSSRTTCATVASASSIVRGRTWAEIARFVAHQKLSETADTYTHVIADATEADYAELGSSRPVEGG